MATITLQPATLPDLSSPYPFHVAENGDVLNQDFWKGDPAAVVGFQDSRENQHVDLWWRDVVADPQRAVGKYPVMVEAGKGLYTYTVPIESISVKED